MGRNPLTPDWNEYEDWCDSKGKKANEMGFLMWLQAKQSGENWKRVDVI